MSELTKLDNFFGYPMMPIGAATHVPMIDQLMVYLHWLMILLFIGWGTFFIYTLVRLVLTLSTLPVFFLN